MTARPLRLLGLGISVYTRIARLTLIEKRVDHDFEEVDVFAAGGPPQDYLRLNPFARIPCLLHGDLVVYETAAICRYVDEVFDGPLLQPRATAARARMAQIVGVLDHYAYRPMIWDLYVERMEREQPDEARIAAALPRIDRVLRQLDDWQAGGAYLAGDAPSLADLHAYPMLDYLADTGEGAALLDGYPRLGEWLARLRSRPSVVATAYRAAGTGSGD